MMHILNRIIPTNGKEKRNDYTIKYNAKMSNNMEMKTVNVKGKEKIVYITKGSNT